MMAARVGSPGSPVQVGLYDVDYAERKPPGNSGEDGRFAHKLATVHDMSVSKNRGAPKWMVYNGKTLLKWMIWGAINQQLKVVKLVEVFQSGLG